MKIIYLHQYFTTPDMPGGTRSYEMAKRLVNSGHEVHIITSWRKEKFQKVNAVEVIDGIHVHWIPVPYDNAMAFWDRIWAFLLFALKAGREATRVEGDLVFATSTPLTIAIPAVLAARRLKVPMVFEVRDLWPEVPIAMGYLRSPITKWAAKWLEKFAYRNSRRVIALSEGMAEGVVRAGYPRSHVSVIPNSCDLDLFAYSAFSEKSFRTKYPELGQGPIILYPGTIGRANGVVYLAHLAKEMSRHRGDVRFVVIGDGAEASLVEKTAREVGVLGINFFQYPAMPKKQVVEAFSAASIIVSLFIDEPALQANSANKFFDGLSSGTPIAINYNGWQRRLLEETGSGIWLGADPVAASKPLVHLLNSPSRVAECGLRARMLAETRFNRDKLACNLENILLDAVKVHINK